MNNLHPVVMVIIQVGAIATALTALFVLSERLWSPTKRWLERILTDPVIERMDEHQDYVRHHLGPNGDTPPIHQRLTHLEKTVDSLKDIL
jgi:hypothetical protein